ncbi:DBH-like monooxygenase protein 1 [Chionoecetes opilio]|uniref:DBH-like monooxygenase protein 1 n=1 Tax=Chionoecetes opilio TaxID=41210 RepID=A0A8J5D064_CHIOP|nr:DBH-like monooxygenase protein 1 [Chionoecetes opilio]
MRRFACCMRGGRKTRAVTSLPITDRGVGTGTRCPSRFYREGLPEDHHTMMVSQRIALPHTQDTYWCHIENIQDWPEKHHYIGYDMIYGENARSNLHHAVALECHAQDGSDPGDQLEQYVGHPGYEYYTPNMPPQFFLDLDLTKFEFDPKLSDGQRYQAAVNSLPWPSLDLRQINKDIVQGDQVIKCQYNYGVLLKHETVRLLYAWGEEDPSGDQPAYHGPRRGNRYAMPLTQFHREGLPEDHHTMMVSQRIAVPHTQDTFYWCHIEKIPDWPEKHHYIGYDMIYGENARSNLHHVVAFECHAQDGSDPGDQLEQYVGHPGYECYTPNMPPQFFLCERFLISWAIGSEALALPVLHNRHLLYPSPPNPGTCSTSPTTQALALPVLHNPGTSLPVLPKPRDCLPSPFSQNPGLSYQSSTTQALSLPASTNQALPFPSSTTQALALPSSTNPGTCSTVLH